MNKEKEFYQGAHRMHESASEVKTLEAFQRIELSTQKELPVSEALYTATKHDKELEIAREAQEQSLSHKIGSLVQRIARR